MAVTFDRFLEITPEESRSAATFTFSQRDGSATWPVVIYGTDEAAGITSDDIQGAITAMMGYTTAVISDGRIDRHLPMAHPLFRTWTCGAISRGQGVGKFDLTAPDILASFDADPPTQWAKYKYLIMEGEFKPRPYQIRPNSEVPVLGSPVGYYDTGGTLRTYTYAPEWERWTQIKTAQIDSDRITAEIGGYKYNTDQATPGNNTGFMGHPQMPLQTTTLFVHWYEVPYRFVTSANSYLTRWRGRINQNAWRGYPAGSLLYDGFTANDYCSPFPSIDALGLDARLGVEFLCDVVLKFVHTTRKITGSPNAAPSNGNYIAAGHNLLPYFPLQTFLYAMSSSGVPSFLSFPLDLLFTDPDAAGGLATTIL
jgi:hypothetical protein